MSFNSAFSYVLYRFVLPHSWGRERRVVEISLLPNRRWAGGSREGMNWRCQCISICYVYDMVWVRWDNYIYIQFIYFIYIYMYILWIVHICPRPLFPCTSATFLWWKFTNTWNWSQCMPKTRNWGCNLSGQSRGGCASKLYSRTLQCIGDKSNTSHSSTYDYIIISYTIHVHE